MAKMPTVPVVDLSKIRDPEALRVIKTLVAYIEQLKSEIERNT